MRPSPAEVVNRRSFAAEPLQRRGAIRRCGRHRRCDKISQHDCGDRLWLFELFDRLELPRLQPVNRMLWLSVNHRLQQILTKITKYCSDGNAR
jgi:hypothetical protein